MQDEGFFEVKAQRRILDLSAEATLQTDDAFMGNCRCFVYILWSG
jgi:hypothetical protein